MGSLRVQMSGHDLTEPVIIDNDCRLVIFYDSVM